MTSSIISRRPCARTRHQKIFEKQGVNQDGKVVGRFRATGVRPKVSERLLAAGIRLPASMFEGVVEVR